MEWTDISDNERTLLPALLREARKLDGMRVHVLCVRGSKGEANEGDIRAAEGVERGPELVEHFAGSETLCHASSRIYDKGTITRTDRICRRLTIK